MTEKPLGFRPLSYLLYRVRRLEFMYERNSR